MTGDLRAPGDIDFPHTRRARSFRVLCRWCRIVTVTQKEGQEAVCIACRYPTARDLAKRNKENQ